MPARTRRRRSHLLLACSAVTLAALGLGCSGAQSALDPAGRDAERIRGIFIWMMAGAAVIWAVVVAMALSLPRVRTEDHMTAGRWLIVGGGVIFPVIVLSAFLTFGLGELPGLLASPGTGRTGLIEITGNQWWWRVQYHPPGRGRVDTANELRLPVGRRVEIRLASADVVHSFWVPSLAGKIDMIPGRLNYIALEPTRTGVFRGACAEFCGSSHARMNLDVIVMDEAEFDTWLDAQAGPAAVPADPLAQQGQTVFLERGCVTCHTVRGTPAAGIVGPDLTHVGSRRTIAAGTLPTTPESFVTWISGTDHIKPDVRMPAFVNLSEDALDALAAYLTGLE